MTYGDLIHDIARMLEKNKEILEHHFEQNDKVIKDFEEAVDRLENLKEQFDSEAM